MFQYKNIFNYSYQKYIDKTIDKETHVHFMTYYQEEIDKLVINELAKKIYSNQSAQQKVDKITTQTRL